MIAAPRCFDLNRSLRAFGRLAAAMLGVIATFDAAVAAPAADQRPNIVFILIDDAGFSDLGAYGGEIATPNLDQIANSGLRFTNFHAASTCEATRAMLQTGVDSHLAGAGTLLVVVADNQRDQPGYEGYLSDRAHSLGQLMRDGGYATYFAGKWNVGNGLERSPGAKGWDRYVSLEQTGADNYEAKVYAPFNMEPVWWEDGRRLRLPTDFYSTNYYVDKIIQYIDEGRGSGKPFMAMVATQAVHSPLQAPQADIDKYLHRYDAGWEAIRAERYQRQVAMGLVPPGLTLPKAAGSKSWATLGDKERRAYAKRMAVFAGMLDHVDQQVGRLREHLRQQGLLDNTVFVIMSDNGADAYDLSQLNLPFKLWYRLNYALGYERMGAKGSYVHYGQDWAQVSNTPFAWFKGTSYEGGMRVPFAISYPGKIKPGVTDQFAFVTDVVPTMLDIAGIARPKADAAGDARYPLAGASMLPLAQGASARIHARDEAFGFESTGGQALFKGDYKLMFNSAIPDDGPTWRLVNLRDDPTESTDLAAKQPDIVAALKADFAAYVARNGVILPPPGFDGLVQLLKNNWPILLRQLAPVIVALTAGLVALIAAMTWLYRRWRRRPPRSIDAAT